MRPDGYIVIGTRYAGHRSAADGPGQRYAFLRFPAPPAGHGTYSRAGLAMVSDPLSGAVRLRSGPVVNSTASGRRLQGAAGYPGSQPIRPGGRGDLPLRTSRGGRVRRLLWAEGVLIPCSTWARLRAGGWPAVARNGRPPSRAIIQAAARFVSFGLVCGDGASWSQASAALVLLPQPGLEPPARRVPGHPGLHPWNFVLVDPWSNRQASAHGTALAGGPVLIMNNVLLLARLPVFRVPDRPGLGRA